MSMKHYSLNEEYFSDTYCTNYESFKQILGSDEVIISGLYLLDIVLRVKVVNHSAAILPQISPIILIYSDLFLLFINQSSFKLRRFLMRYPICVQILKFLLLVIEVSVIMNSEFWFLYITIYLLDNESKTLKLSDLYAKNNILRSFNFDIIMIISQQLQK